MDRRSFLRASALTVGGLATHRVLPLGGHGATLGVADVHVPGPLYIPPTVSPDGLVLTARGSTAEIAPGVRSPILTLGDGPVAPTIRARAGDRARITLKNALSEPTILHWHGLRPPEKDDGHPRLAIDPGEEYRYDFTLDERAGTYWYHPHPHMRTAAQVHLGMAGLFLITDREEQALGLPDGDRELGLVLQDKRPDAEGRIGYNVTMGHDMMEGLLGSAAYVNGVRQPTVEVDSALYRVRVLGGANARIFRLALSNGRPLTLIGTDGGLLERPVSLPHMDLSTGERADLLLDFTGLAAGTRVMLTSLAFEAPYRGMGGMGGGMGMGRGMMGGMGGGGVIPNGGAMDLLEFVVAREVRASNRVPERLSTIPPVQESAITTTREFRFRSAMMQHTINGAMFEMDRMDVTMPFGATERWTFINDGPFPHPVHMHAVHFRVLAREGVRDQLFPWEQGWKDTVLVYPGERVSVMATFDRHRGRFLMHCHNLEHEDHGMMLNFRVE
jgi:FtsP/CotA-like multicopper oxidase with cupredoxin domain